MEGACLGKTFMSRDNSNSILSRARGSVTARARKIWSQNAKIRSGRPATVSLEEYLSFWLQ